MNGSCAEVFSEYEKIRDAGLDLPEACKLVEQMNRRGYGLDRRLIRMTEVMDAVAEAVKGGGV